MLKNSMHWHPHELCCEYLENPVGIDIKQPRFSWKLGDASCGAAQSAYQILVTKNPEMLHEDKGDAWDSGKVASDTSVNVPYTGEPLISDTSYYWKVKVWDANDTGKWSPVAHFHTGLMDQTDWTGSWIGHEDVNVASPLLRKEFSLTDSEAVQAYAHFCGLGYGELYINGHKVGDNVLDPGTTEYDKRALYQSYDIKSYLKTGKNAVGLILGRGWYVGSENRERPLTKQYGDRPRALLQINVFDNDGNAAHLATDNTWKAVAGPILENDIWNGEVYDARQEKPGWAVAGFDDKDWPEAECLQSPGGRLDAQLMPPIRITETRRPVRMTEPEQGIYVFDFGEVITGWARIQVCGDAGTQITMCTAEVTHKEMAEMQEKPLENNPELIDTAPNRTAKARDVYILKGGGDPERYEPRFTYHGFRYVQLEGMPQKPSMLTLEARVVHTAVKRTGEFRCSDPLLEKIHQNTIRGQLSNLHSMPTDCPQRDERQGWTGDGHLTLEEASFNFDMAAFYTKWLQDMKASQAEAGSIPDCVPYHDFGGNPGTPAWQVAYPLTVWHMYAYYMDTRVLHEHYQALAAWIQYMHDLADNYIVEAGRGDWVPPKRTTPEHKEEQFLSSTAYYYRGVEIMADTARIIGKTDDERHYRQLTENIRAAFNQRFFDTKDGCYQPLSQASQAIPLYLQLVPKEHEQSVLETLVNLIMDTNDGHLWIGILGTKALVNLLPRFGRSDVMYTMATQETFPSWGYMIAKGATTLWERWGGYKYFDAGMNSLNHIMFGSVDEFFYRDIAGIAPEAPGYKKIRIRPRLTDTLTQASGSVTTMFGDACSSWRIQGNELQMEVSIPPNTTGEVWVPKRNQTASRIRLNGFTAFCEGKLYKEPEGIFSGRDEGDTVVFEVCAGRYSFCSA